MGFLKKVFLLSLLGLAGWGIYSAGQNDLFSFLNSESEEQVQLAKKDRAVKPKSFFSKVRDVMPAPVKQYDYTFLKRWKTWTWNAMSISMARLKS